MTAVKAGLVYFALVFAAGFALGTIRVLFVVPAVGEAPAVLVEIPIMLTISWIVCRLIVRRFAVPPVIRDRAVTGGLAFALLMTAEIGVAWLLGRRSVSAYLAHYVTLAGAFGLAGQLAFAAFPLLQLKLSSRSSA